MSFVAVTEPVRTLGQAVEELLVLVRNQAGGSCVWCGSRELTAAVADRVEGGGVASNDDCIIVTCRACGAELVSERSLRMRGRRA